MKKQIITVVAVALAALLLFGAYSIFFKDDGISESTDSFYALDADVKTALGKLDRKTEIILSGYNADNDYWVILSTFAASIEAASKKISLSTEEKEGDGSVIVAVGDSRTEIPFADFYKKLYDGTYYAFDGESLICNAIFSLAGSDTMQISLRALDGYDTDGDTVTTTGYPFMFQSLDRSSISFLTIDNSFGSYSIYQQDGSFYFSDSKLVSYDDEAFSMLTTECRYPVSLGKMTVPEGRSFADYKLDTKDNATASYSLMTAADSSGRYFLHTVYIGALASTGNFYYARYIGGLFEPSENEGESDKMIRNLSKDFIYLVSASDVSSTLLLPSTDFMTATLVYGVSSTNDALTIKDIHIDYIKEGITAFVRNMTAFNAASNLSTNNTSMLTKVICDKTFASDYSSYDTVWSDNTAVFGGFTSSDGKSTYIEAALAKYAKDGNYRIVFGLLRDEANGAYLPQSVKITVSSDGINYFAPESSSLTPSQNDKEVKKYTLEFTSEERVKYVRIRFDVPQTANTYVVFDEIRIYASDEDAQPTDSVSGIWRLTRPEQYIDDGRNFAYLDSTNFSDLIYSLATLTGDSVVACGISENGNPDKLDAEKLAKYGLDDPEKHYSYVYNGITSDLYVSASDGNGNYYVYSVISGESDGQSVRFCTDVICKLSVADFSWLDWKFVELLDHSLLSMYITEIDEMSISFEGKDYVFLPKLNSDDDIEKVMWDGQALDVKSFKYLYQSILSIYMQDEYVPSEGDEPREYLRIGIKSDSRSPVIVFYRVSASKCYFTVDGQGSYYALVEDVNVVINNVLKYIDGQEVR